MLAAAVKENQDREPEAQIGSRPNKGTGFSLDAALAKIEQDRLGVRCSFCTAEIDSSMFKCRELVRVGDSETHMVACSDCIETGRAA